MHLEPQQASVAGEVETTSCLSLSIPVPTEPTPTVGADAREYDRVSVLCGQRGRAKAGAKWEKMTQASPSGR
jgi:hypothetical protein